jgi:hypothetical protein
MKFGDYIKQKISFVKTNDERALNFIKLLEFPEVIRVTDCSSPMTLMLRNESFRVRRGEPKN